jgi:disulfide bond formation protein DsbB
MKNKYQYLPYIAWFVSLAAMMGSLFFSNVKGFPPCVLCWYQRIFMYPLVLIIPIGILKKDKVLSTYVLWLASFGAIISIYHNLLYYGLVGSVCTDFSCTTKFIEYFGFITIPFLSLVAFLIIITSMVTYKHYGRQTE